MDADRRRSASRSRPAPPTTAATSRRPTVGTSTSRSNCPCTLFPSATPTTPATSDAHGRRARREVPRRRRRLRHRRPLLQGPATPAPTSAPVDHDGHAARHGTFTNETATGWQQVTSVAGRRSPPNTDLRRLVPHHRGPLRGRPDGYFSTRRRHGAAARAREARRATPNGVYRTAPRPFPTSTQRLGQLLGRRRLRRPTRTPPTRPLDDAARTGPTGIAPTRHGHATFTKPIAGSTRLARRQGTRQRRSFRGRSTVDPANTTATLTPSSAAGPAHDLHRDGERRGRPAATRWRRRTRGRSPPPSCRAVPVLGVRADGDAAEPGRVRQPRRSSSA